MVQPVDRQPAFVLHRRAYRESSALVELLTRDFGLVGGVMRGVKRSGTARDVEPFGRIAVNWRGRGQLVTLFRAETDVRRTLTGDALFAGLYINELLVKTLGREEPVVDLFGAYDTAVAALALVSTATMNGHGRRQASSGVDAASPPTDDAEEGPLGLEPILRTFERQLLDELGYGIAFDVDVTNGRPIEPGRFYRVVDGEGFVEVDTAQASASQVYDGAQIAAMDAGEYGDRAVLQGAKRILRRAIAVRLGGKPLTTRRLFSAARHLAGDRQAMAQLPS